MNKQRRLLVHFQAKCKSQPPRTQAPPPLNLIYHSSLNMIILTVTMKRMYFSAVQLQLLFGTNATLLYKQAKTNGSILFRLIKVQIPSSCPHPFQPKTHSVPKPLVPNSIIMSKQRRLIFHYSTRFTVSFNVFTLQISSSYNQ